MSTIISRQGTIIDVTFTDSKARVRASRIRESDFRPITAELTFFTDLPDKFNTQINHSRINLLDNMQKGRLITTLEDATSNYPYMYWGDVVQQACDAICDTFREGSPPIRMTNLGEDPMPRSYMLSPFFTRSVNNLVYSPGGSGKSLWALLGCIILDRNLKNVHGMSAYGKTNCLYLDWEEDVQIFKSRLFSLGKGLGLENPNESGILWKRMERSLPDEVDSISDICLQNSINYVVCDSVSPALGGSANDQEVIERYVYALRALGDNITTVSLDHTNKEGTLYGSSYKMARARQVYQIKLVDSIDLGEKGGQIEIVLYHEKTNDSKKRSPRGFKITFNDKPIENSFESYTDSIKFETMKLGSNIKALRTLSIQGLCLELIKEEGSQSVSELARSIGIIRSEDISPYAVKSLLVGYNSLTIADDDMVSLTYDHFDEMADSVDEVQNG